MGLGTKDIEWPDERAKRLGIQLLLFRRFASGEIEPGAFAFTLFRSGANINDGIADIVGQIFTPMCRELRRYLEEALARQDDSPSHVPASDRIVTLDHNSEAYRETIEQLDRLVEVLEQVNDYPDIEDKEQRIAELSAGRRMLQSARVRCAAVAAVLGPPLAWLTEKFAGGLIGQIAGSVWQAVKALVGL
jgi:hypothetical protein